MLTARVHEAPPSLETNAAIFPLRLSNGTTTVPSGWTSGWAAEALVVAGGLDRDAPCHAAVGRRAHQLTIAVAEVVELRVAMAAERRARAVVAHGPVLVEVDAVRDGRRDLDGRAAGAAVVGRAVDEHRGHRGAWQQRDRGDQPRRVRGVVRHARVADPLEWTGRRA